MTDNELLAAAIEASGMSKMAFARNVLVREYRTLRRWASGQSPMPKAVRVYLEEYLRKRPAKRNVVLPSPHE